MHVHDKPNEGKYLADEFLLLRLMIGIMGMVLPLVLVVGMLLFSGCTVMQPSISHYYYTNMGNVFVAYVICLAVFLLAYPGYEKDHIFSKLAFVFGCAFAFLPTEKYNPATCSECHYAFPGTPHTDHIVGIIHLCCASTFIAILAYYSGCLFTKTEDDKAAVGRKKKRNVIYITCAIIMVLALAFLGTLLVLDNLGVNCATNLLKTPVIFWGEVVALEAFGFSWLVKGGVLWRDVNDPHPSTAKMAKHFLLKRRIKK